MFDGHGRHCPLMTLREKQDLPHHWGYKVSHLDISIDVGMVGCIAQGSAPEYASCHARCSLHVCSNCRHSWGTAARCRDHGWGVTARRARRDHSWRAMARGGLRREDWGATARSGRGNYSWGATPRAGWGQDRGEGAWARGWGDTAADG